MYRGLSSSLCSLTLSPLKPVLCAECHNDWSSLVQRDSHDLLMFQITQWGTCSGA